jgi:ABC-type sugar transport system substrate-binding protein
MRSSAWRRHLGAAATIFVAAVGVAACGEDDSSNNAAGGDGASGGQTIGASMLNMRDPDLAAMNEAMTAKAEELGQELASVDAKGDVATELTQIEDLVTKDVDAIIMMPIDGEASQPAAKRVNEAGIPLFTLSTEFADGNALDIESYIGVDDTEAGRMQADYLAEQLPEGGKIIYIVGTYGASWTDRRKAGFMEKKPDNIEIATELQANGSRDEAKRIMEDLLRKYDEGEIAGLVAHNDEMAIGASQAINEAGRQDEFKVVVGVDGTQPGLETIEEGGMTATILQQSAEQGKKAVEVASDFLAGDAVEETNNLPFTLVTKDNVAEFLN